MRKAYTGGGSMTTPQPSSMSRYFWLRVLPTKGSMAMGLAPGSRLTRSRAGAMYSMAGSAISSSRVYPTSTMPTPGSLITVRTAPA